MRNVPFNDKTKEVLKLVLENSPAKAIGMEDMRRRVALQESIAESAEGNDSFMVEESDHKIISEAVTTFPWTKATRELLDTIDSIVDAEEISPANLKVVQ